ncbi:MAG: hypothetical protein IJQ58_03150 [Synergistaceae bacterium]|nr:hypothetical protein [Synergistaceae bacterium]
MRRQHFTPKPKVYVLAEEYRNAGIIPQSQKQDSRHIAVASLYELSGIVSYNFHHINRDKTKALIPEVNERRDLGGIMFFTAEEAFEYYDKFFEEEELGEMDPIEAEVYAIRRQIDEEIKGMTPEEVTAYFMRETEGITKQFHMKTSRLKPAKLGYRPRQPDEVYSELPYPE